MRRVIAVEDTLGNIRQMLENEGYEVLRMGDDGFKEADAVVVSGLEDNYMGIEDRQTEAFVLNARGRQPEEILYDLEKHFKMME